MATASHQRGEAKHENDAPPLATKLDIERRERILGPTPMRIRATTPDSSVSPLDGSGAEKTTVATTRGSRSGGGATSNGREVPLASIQYEPVSESVYGAKITSNVPTASGDVRLKWSKLVSLGCRGSPPTEEIAPKSVSGEDSSDRKTPDDSFWNTK